MTFDKQFLDWIEILLYYPEKEILLNHLQPCERGYQIFNLKEAKAKFKLNHHKLYKIVWKLEFLTRLYEEQHSSD